MADLTYNTKDSTGLVPDDSLIGVKLLHLGRMSVYHIDGFCWLGENDEWGYLHHEVRGDGLNGPTIARPMHHLLGTRSNGEPRYRVLGSLGLADYAKSFKINAGPENEAYPDPNLPEDSPWQSKPSYNATVEVEWVGDMPPAIADVVRRLQEKG